MKKQIYWYNSQEIPIWQLHINLFTTNHVHKNIRREIEKIVESKLGEQAEDKK